MQMMMMRRRTNQRSAVKKSVSFFIMLFTARRVYFRFLDSAIQQILLLRFSKTHALWSSKANWRLHFSLPSIILADLLGNRTLLKWIQKVMVCDLWLVDFDLFLFQGSLCVIVIITLLIIMIDSSEKRIKLWRRLLNLRVCVFVKCTVKSYYFWIYQGGTGLYSCWAQWPLAPNFCSQVTRKSKFFHPNHMLATLDFTGSEHWAPFNFL